MSEQRSIALVLAAGRGNRFGGSKPKQLIDLCGRPLFSHALHQHVDLGHTVIVVVSNSTREAIVRYVAGVMPNAGIVIATGGETRGQSILAAIDAIPSDSPPETRVLLRNSVSPNTSTKLLNEVVRGLDTYDGVQAYVPSHQTAFLHRDGQLISLYDQSSMGFTVDPTGYRLDLLTRIAETMRPAWPGETSLDIARGLGARIGLVESPVTNIKLTTPGDLDRLSAYMSDEGDAQRRAPSSDDD